MKICVKCEEEKEVTSFGILAISEDGRNPRCKTCMREYHKNWRRQKPGHMEKMRAVGKKYRDDAKSLVFAHYGATCQCCGEGNLRFLSVDHIQGGGSQHRLSLGSPTICLWLVKNNFPDGFQILCFNCNWGKHTNGGHCPHEDPV